MARSRHWLGGLKEAGKGSSFYFCKISVRARNMKWHAWKHNDRRRRWERNYRYSPRYLAQPFWVCAPQNQRPLERSSYLSIQDRLQDNIKFIKFNVAYLFLVSSLTTRFGSKGCLRYLGNGNSFFRKTVGTPTNPTHRWKYLKLSNHRRSQRQQQQHQQRNPIRSLLLLSRRISPVRQNG